MPEDDATGDAGADVGESQPEKAAAERAADVRTAETADADEPLPADVVDEAERLTRLARRAAVPDEAEAYRRERASLLAEHDYVAMVRSESDGDVLVCHPEEWLVDGDVDPERIDDVDRGVEVPLSGSEDPEDWETVAAENQTVVDAVRAAHGDVHGDNAAALAEYVNNHYAKPLAAVTAPELRHFREEYYVRNVWPSDEQADALDRSLELVYEELSVPLPED